MRLSSLQNNDKKIIAQYEPWCFLFSTIQYFASILGLLNFQLPSRILLLTSGGDKGLSLAIEDELIFLGPPSSKKVLGSTASECVLKSFVDNFY